MWMQILVVCCLLVSVLGASLGQDQEEFHGCQAGVKGMVGGWTKMDETTMIDSRKELEQLASLFLTDENAKSNNLVKYQLSRKDDNSPQILNAYTQVVAGMNYCIEFVAEGAGCKNGSKADYCKNLNLKCIVQIYKPLPILVKGAIPSPKVTKKVCKEQKSSPR